MNAFFGDAEYAFHLTPNLIIELEQKTGTGIASLCRRVFAGEFNHADIIETIRLALIGGGTSPARAAALVAAYAYGRPISETLPLTNAIFETLWFGPAETEIANG